MKSTAAVRLLSAVGMPSSVDAVYSCTCRIAFSSQPVRCLGDRLRDREKAGGGDEPDPGNVRVGVHRHLVCAGNRGRIYLSLILPLLPTFFGVGLTLFHVVYGVGFMSGRMDVYLFELPLRVRATKVSFSVLYFPSTRGSSLRLCISHCCSFLLEFDFDQVLPFWVWWFCFG